MVEFFIYFNNSDMQFDIDEDDADRVGTLLSQTNKFVNIYTQGKHYYVNTDNITYFCVKPKSPLTYIKQEESDF